MSRLLSCAVVVAGLVGCQAAQMRPDEKTFELVDQGQISPASTRLFVDCITDGFRTVKHIQRSTGTRVELADNAALITLSAEVMDSGRVELYRSSAAWGVPNTKERATFNECLEKHHTTK